MRKQPALLALILVLTLLAACVRTPQSTAQPTGLPSAIPTEPPATPASQATETSSPASPTPPTTTLITPANAAALQNYHSLELPMDAASVLWSLDGTKIVVTAYKGVMVIDSQTYEIIQEVTLPETETLVDVSADGRNMATTIDFITITVSDISTGQVTATITPEVPFVGAGFSPDGSQFVVASGEQWAAMIYDLPGGELVDTITGFETAAPVYTVRLAPDGANIVWLSRGTIQLESIATQTLGEAIHHEDFITGFSLTRSGDLLATTAGGSVNGVFTPLVLLWEPFSGEKIGHVEMSFPVNSLEFSPDGALLAGTSDDQVVLLDVSGQSQVFSESAHPGGAWSARFSPNGEILASVGADNQLRFWTAE